MMLHILNSFHITCSLMKLKEKTLNGLKERDTLLQMILFILEAVRKKIQENFYGHCLCNHSSHKQI